MARNTECTPQITKQIAGRIANGLSNRDAVALSAITEATFYNWLKRGESWLHQRFEHKRVKGEWFNLNENDTRLILDFFEGYEVADFQQLELIKNEPTN